MVKKKLYQCPECGLHYVDKAVAEECEAFCKTYKGCSLEITQHAVENKKAEPEGPANI